MTATRAEALQAPGTQRMLGRAAAYQLLSLAFSYPEAECLGQLQTLIEDVSDHRVAQDLDLRAPLEALAVALKSATPDALAGEHTRLFAGQVVCSAHETEYEFDPFAKARQLADISGFYRAFGLQVAEGRAGLPDFIAAELEFMSLIVLKQAYAAVHAWEKREQLSADAQRKFIEDHLGRWVPLFCRNLARLGTGFYAAAADLCDRFLRAEVELVGARPQPLAKRITFVDDDEEFTCGLAAPPDGEAEGSGGPDRVGETGGGESA